MYIYSVVVVVQNGLTADSHDSMYIYDNGAFLIHSFLFNEKGKIHIYTRHNQVTTHHMQTCLFSIIFIRCPSFQGCAAQCGGGDRRGRRTV
jgi:hypothetical protein